MLSEVVFARTYAKTLSNGKKETYEECVERVENMHINKFPHLAVKIHQHFKMVFDKKVVPSMRSMQFAGKGIEDSNARMYNCSFTNIESFRDISDILYLLLCGTGCGFSVQRRHVEKLPVINIGDSKDSFVIPDSKEGWADSIFSLMENPEITFSYALIRPRGSPLSTGGTASGPETLETLHKEIRTIVRQSVGRKLKPIEVHDILCQISDLVVCAGSRRSALISLFDVDEEDMMNCKSGNWFNTHSFRCRANNSAVLIRNSPTIRTDLERVVRRCFANGTGEPGIFLTNDADYGTNPCCEISLRSKQMCNLTEVNVHACQSRQDLLDAVSAAVVLGTLQASYTHFPYIQPAWSENCKEDALLGVSMTGIAQNWPFLSEPGLLDEAAAVAKRVNREWAVLLGINSAARIGCVKPSGSTSALLGTTSGIHAAHASFYLRRVRIETDSPLCCFLLSVMNRGNAVVNALRVNLEKERKEKEKEKKEKNAMSVLPESFLEALSQHSISTTTPLEALARLADSTVAVTKLPILETDVYARKSAQNYVVRNLVLTMPISMEGAILRSEETPVQLLDRAAFVHKHFIQPSHTSGPNFHNVSLTVNYRPSVAEEGRILAWLLEHTDCFAGVSMFPDNEATATEDEEKQEEEKNKEGMEKEEVNNNNGKNVSSNKKTKEKEKKITPMKYPQTPFEEISREEYIRWMEAWGSLGLLVREHMLDSLIPSPSTSASELVSESTGNGTVKTSQPSSMPLESEEKQQLIDFLTSDRFSSVGAADAAGASVSPISSFPTPSPSPFSVFPSPILSSSSLSSTLLVPDVNTPTSSTTTTGNNNNSNTLFDPPSAEDCALMLRETEQNMQQICKKYGSESDSGSSPVLASSSSSTSSSVLTHSPISRTAFMSPPISPPFSLSLSPPPFLTTQKKFSKHFSVFSPPKVVYSALASASSSASTCSPCSLARVCVNSDGIDNIGMSMRMDNQSGGGAEEGSINSNKERVSVEDSFQVLRMGLSRIMWDPKAKDTRRQILACGGGNCEYV